MIDSKVLNSPIRWAGSKKKILNEMLNAFRREKENYIECFLGSGVVLINVLKNNDKLKYKNFSVNDINSNIINFYKLLQDKPNYLINEISKLADDYNKLTMKEKAEYYYEKRDKFNDTRKKNEKSVLFYFLMKTGFNGVYRENSLGKFNVPFGKKEKIVVNREYLEKMSELIQPVVFYNLTYEEFLDEMKTQNKIANSFMYFDPPYLPDDMLVSQKQELYTNDTFDHVKFVKTVSNLKAKCIMISMSDSKSADDIYLNGIFEKNSMKEILRTINPKKLFSSTEIAFTNYQIRIKVEE